MTIKNCIRIFAVLSIICALTIGVYTGFSQTGPNTISSRAVMVCVIK